MPSVESRTLLLLPLLVELRIRLIAVVDRTSDGPLTRAWSVTSARFGPLLGALGDPEYLEANDDALLALGLCGPELAYRAAGVVDSPATQTARWLAAAASILGSLAAMPSIGPDASALAGFCDALRIDLDPDQRR